MRLFIAVEIDAAVARELARVAAELRKRVEALAPRSRLTWVATDRLHFTLRFLGEVDDAQVPVLKAALAPELATPAFDLVVSGLGVFPPRGTPRVIWAGVAAGREEMMALEQEVGSRLEVGATEERYTPHLTLARVRDAAGLRTRDLLEGAPQGAIGTTRVKAITLFESRLSPRGPTYVPLLSTNLQAAM